MIVSVIGLGKLGARIATRLSEKGIEVIAIDKNLSLVEKIKDIVTHSICVDVTDEKALRSVNISEVDVAVVAIGDNIEISIMAVAMLRKLGVGRVLARATNQLHEHVLEEIGASEIIKVEEDMGDIVASKIVATNIVQQYSFAPGYSVVQAKLGKYFGGKTLVESQLRQVYSINSVAIERKVPYITEDGKSDFRIEVDDNPVPMSVIEEDDIVVMVGSDKNFRKLFNDLSIQ
jgi:trk system potassium uptake protein TrkA